MSLDNTKSLIANVSTATEELGEVLIIVPDITQQVVDVYAYPPADAT